MRNAFEAAAESIKYQIFEAIWDDRVSDLQDLVKRWTHADSRACLVALGTTIDSLYCEPDCFGISGHPAHFAAEKGRVKCLEVIASAGLSVDCSDPNGRRPMHRAACNFTRNSAEIVDVLIRLGTDPLARDNDGNTPVHIAVLSNALEIIEVFFKNRVSLVEKNNEGKTPLDLARESDQIKPSLRARLEDLTDPEKDFFAKGVVALSGPSSARKSR